MALGVGLAGVRPALAQSYPTAPSLDEAYRLYYVGRYEESAALALNLRATSADVLETYEVRSSALHFRLKRELSGSKDKKAALKTCVPCQGWLTELKADIAAGRAMAKAALAANDKDENSRFLLGKIDLTHVWLHLETLGQRTGWGEYWEARRSLDTVIERQPNHIRAQVSRAWIDYIVDTRVPLGVRWMLGGGNKKRALEVARRSASAPNTDTYTRAEAGFALWEMLVREKRKAEAVTIATTLAREFPENRELAKFLSES